MLTSKVIASHNEIRLIEVVSRVESENGLLTYYEWEFHNGEIFDKFKNYDHAVKEFIDACVAIKSLRKTPAAPKLLRKVSLMPDLTSSIKRPSIRTGDHIVLLHKGYEIKLIVNQVKDARSCLCLLECVNNRYCGEAIIWLDKFSLETIGAKKFQLWKHIDWNQETMIDVLDNLAELQRNYEQSEKEGEVAIPSDFDLDLFLSNFTEEETMATNEPDDFNLDDFIFNLDLDNPDDDLVADDVDIFQQLDDIKTEIDANNGNFISECQCGCDKTIVKKGTVGLHHVNFKHSLFNGNEPRKMWFHQDCDRCGKTRLDHWELTDGVGGHIYGRKLIEVASRPFLQWIPIEHHEKDVNEIIAQIYAEMESQFADSFEYLPTAPYDSHTKSGTPYYVYKTGGNKQDARLLYIPEFQFGNSVKYLAISPYDISLEEHYGEKMRLIFLPTPDSRKWREASLVATLTVSLVFRVLQLAKQENWYDWRLMPDKYYQP